MRPLCYALGLDTSNPIKAIEMSIPNEALQKLVQEIETQAVNAQREINVVKATIVSKQRDIRMLELTSTEVKQLSANTNVYEGVGKM
ncbi:MAG: hypothetical protein Q9185_002117 [Variospora sp. 1 TL-2023]